MTQSKRDSLKETLCNTGVGMIGSWLITMASLSVLTSPVAIATVTTIGCTIWSIGRGYTFRRYFNNKFQKGENKR